jgi:hypothetical protein
VAQVVESVEPTEQNAEQTEREPLVAV